MRQSNISLILFFLFLVGSPQSRKQSFSLNLMNAARHSNSDYESITPFSPENVVRTNCACQLKKRDACPTDDPCDCHDYESIRLVGFVNKEVIDQKSCDTKGVVLEQLHDYAHIPNMERVEEADTPGITPLDSIFHKPVKVVRKNLLKIDSFGYASVLPSSQAEDDSCKLDCHYQDEYRRDNSGPPLSSSCPNKVIVSNVEEAWQHQQERGYAALTLKSRPPCPPPPLINRTSSDGLLSNSFSNLHPGATAQDYEVPVQILTLPPPLSVTNRKNSVPRTRKRAVSTFTTEQDVLRHLEGTRLSIVNEDKHNDEVDTKEAIEHAEGVPSTVLIDLSTRKHSASDVLEVTTHSPQLPRHSQ